MDKEVTLIGYSGHAYVVADILLKMGRAVACYCEIKRKGINPYDLKYLGNEDDPETIKKLQKYDYILAVGDNILREKLSQKLKKRIGKPVNAIHPNATTAGNVSLGSGVVIGAAAVINSFADIGNDVICNTGCVIEHECIIGDFSHIGPSATLLGNVQVGVKCLIGGNAIIKPGTTIGDNVTVGAGSVVLNDIQSGMTVAGNPAREI